MAIKWEDGAIDGQPHIIRPNQQLRLLRNMPHFSVTYIDIEDVRSSVVDRSLWAHGDATGYSAQQVPKIAGLIDLIRVIQVNDGLIADFSHTKDAIDDTTISFLPDRLIEREDEWMPITGLVETDEQRLQIGTILFNKYGFMLERSALEHLRRDD